MRLWAKGDSLVPVQRLYVNWDNWKYYLRYRIFQKLVRIFPIHAGDINLPQKHWYPSLTISTYLTLTSSSTKAQKGTFVLRTLEWLRQLATVSPYTLITYSFQTFSQTRHNDDIICENKEILTFPIILKTALYCTLI